MSNQPIISVSGLRGIIGTSLDPALAARYVSAFAGERGPGPIIVTRDGRATGPMLVDAIRSGLVASGRDVVDAGVAATPTLGVLVRHLQAAGGVQISASHNPPEYNGIKLFDDAGRVLPGAVGQRVLERFQREDFAWVPHDQLGEVSSLDETWQRHLELVLDTVDVESIRKSAFKVLLDSNHGAGAGLGVRLLETLGCEVTVLGQEPTGMFEHPPEPTAENLVSVTERVKEVDAAVGFCQDPDADRLALIDENGRYIGEEYTVAITVQHALTQRHGPIVTNCATSRMAQDIADQSEAPFFRSAVGEANVTDEMLRVTACYGGEGNGGPIDPRVGYVRDSFVGMAQVLDAMASSGKKLSEIVTTIPCYAIRKSKASVEGLDLEKVIAALESRFEDAESSRLDGLRLDWDGRWLLVRGSNTEPIVRIIAEASSPEAADQMIAAASEVIANV